MFTMLINIFNVENYTLLPGTVQTFIIQYDYPHNDDDKNNILIFLRLPFIFPFPSPPLKCLNAKVYCMLAHFEFSKPFINHRSILLSAQDPLDPQYFGFLDPKPKISNKNCQKNFTFQNQIWIFEKRKIIRIS